ncbi:MAG: hypothetical protein GTO54_02760 [Nitrososphaeria archaeon]|nr:hypothetical protein [Nitrososphaeria archaeon]
MKLEDWKDWYMKFRPTVEDIPKILADWEEDRHNLQKIIDDNQDAAVLRYQDKEESHGNITGFGKFRFDKGYGQHHE